MSTERQNPSDEPASTFAKAAGERPIGFLAEFWAFVRQNKKWWLTPIIITLLLVAVLVMIGASGGGPLTYTLF